MNLIDDFIPFLHRSPTAQHASKEIANRLSSAAFTLLVEKERWHLEEGKGYFVFRGGALIAFRMPKKFPQKALLAASHIDSPALKLKPQPYLESKGILQLSTEIYGGPTLHTWFDRDLYLAGEVAFLDSKKHPQTSLVELGEFPILIPNIAFHLERSISEKGFHVQKQDHLKAIFSTDPSTPSLESILLDHLKASQILGFDLFLVPLEKPAFLGASKELLSSYRLDNLSSAHSSLHALLHAKASSHSIQMAIFWDHEEIGSISYAGAESDFTLQVLERICLHCKIEREDFMRLKANSFCLSLDVAHGFHPNFPEKSEPQNTPNLGKGVAFKFNAAQKYASSSSAGAPLIHLCQTHNIPYQFYAARSDTQTGSTVGSIMAANLGILTADLGVPIWAMHSIRETLAFQDQKALHDLVHAVFQDELVAF